MKNFFLILVLCMFIFVSRTYAASEFEVEIKNKSKLVNNVNILLDDKKFKSEFKAYILDGRTFVPIREISESLGVKVDWNNEVKSASIYTEINELKIKVYSNIVYKDGNKIKLDDASRPVFAKYFSPREETKTMVPLRFLSEAMGFKVDWDNKNKTAFIYSKNKKPQNNENSKYYNEKANNKISSNNKKVSNNFETFISENEIKQHKSLEKLSEKEIFKAASLGLNDDYKEDRIISKNFKIKDKLTIVLDAGHGGIDPGAETESGLTEKELNLKVVKKLYKLLQDTNYEVILTRDRDEYIKLIDRSGLANDKDAELFLSIHFNKSQNNEEAKGIEVLYASANDVKIKTVEQNLFAKELLKSLLNSSGANSRGIKNRPDLVVLNKTKNVAALAELGFMSNEEEYENITNDEYLEKLAQGLFEGINNYVEKYGQK